MDIREIRNLFSPLVDLPSWGVENTYGSFITMNFGEPFIEVSPVIYIGNDSPRRSVSILGKWRLVLQFCAWSIRRNNQTIATWKSSNGLIDHALKVLSGQSILNVDVNSQSARTIFTFDLGCIVTTWPYDADGEQWSLFDPNGYVLMLRGDARCRYGPSDHIPSDEWTNIVSA